MMIAHFTSVEGHPLHVAAFYSASRGPAGYKKITSPYFAVQPMDDDRAVPGMEDVTCEPGLWRVKLKRPTYSTSTKKRDLCVVANKDIAARSVMMTDDPWVACSTTRWRADGIKNDGRMLLGDFARCIDAEFPFPDDTNWMILHRLVMGYTFESCGVPGSTAPEKSDAQEAQRISTMDWWEHENWEHDLRTASLVDVQKYMLYADKICNGVDHAAADQKASSSRAERRRRGQQATSVTSKPVQTSKELGKLVINSTGVIWDADKLAILFKIVVANANPLCAPISDKFYGVGIFKNLRKIQHSCRPNCMIVYLSYRAVVIALRDIKEGEHITVSCAGVEHGALAVPRLQADAYIALVGAPCQCKQCLGIMRATADPQISVQQSNLAVKQLMAARALSRNIAQMEQEVAQDKEMPRAQVSAKIRLLREQRVRLMLNYVQIHMDENAPCQVPDGLTDQDAVLWLHHRAQMLMSILYLQRKWFWPTERHHAAQEADEDSNNTYKALKCLIGMLEMPSLRTKCLTPYLSSDLAVKMGPDLENNGLEPFVLQARTILMLRTGSPTEDLWREQLVHVYGGPNVAKAVELVERLYV